MTMRFGGQSYQCQCPVCDGDLVGKGMTAQDRIRTAAPGHEPGCPAVVLDPARLRRYSGAQALAAVKAAATVGPEGVPAREAPPPRTAAPGPAAMAGPEATSVRSGATTPVARGRSPVPVPAQAAADRPEVCSALMVLEPASAPILEMLGRRGVLANRSGVTGTSVLDLLVAVRTAPRAPGLHPRHVYWSLLERLYDPLTNTQLVEVPFREGELDTQTCVAASHLFTLIDRAPAEYCRLVEAVTSAHGRYPIAHLVDPVVAQARTAWLAGAFPVEQRDRALVVWISADPAAAGRAATEHDGRRFREYAFGVRRPKNSRLVVDVMVQSALTNYAMQGRYDSEGDCDRDTGERGLPPPDSSPGHAALVEDILGQQDRPSATWWAARRVRVSGTVPVLSQAEAMDLVRHRISGGHLLPAPLLIDIDADIDIHQYAGR